MIHIVDAAIVAHPSVEPTLFVDDVSSEKAGDADDIAEELGSFTWLLVQPIRADDMEVSATKSLVSASNPSLGKAIEYKLQVEQANYEQSLAGSTRSTPTDSPSLPQGISTQVVSPPAGMSIDRLPLWRGCRRGPIGGRRQTSKQTREPINQACPQPQRHHQTAKNQARESGDQ